MEVSLKNEMLPKNVDNLVIFRKFVFGKTSFGTIIEVIIYILALVEVCPVAMLIVLWALNEMAASRYYLFYQGKDKTP